MNFDFSEEQQLLRETARRFLSERDARGRARTLLDAGGGFDADLWREMAGLGWLGAALPEEVGGAGLGYVDLCVLAEEIGRANAAVPFDSTVFLAAEAIARHGSVEQRGRWLPRIAGGEVIAAFATAEGPGRIRQGKVRTTVRDGRMNGTKVPVADGTEAHLLVILANGDSGDGLFLVEADAQGIDCAPLQMNDASRPAATVTLDNVPAEALGGGWSALESLFDRAAVLIAFEQLGGAQACLEMARDYALERFAFGRPIGSFQAIKHKLADVYIAIELARSNAWYGAWALAADAPELPVAAAAARVAGCRAFELASKENIQTHGGMGFTWAMDPHLYYRRAQALGLALGSPRAWKDRLVTRLEQRNAP